MTAPEPGPMEVEQVAIDELVPDERNARKGDVPALMSSLRELGQHRPVVARRDTKQIVAGHHLCLAARALGWTHVAVTWVDDDDKKAARRALADNLVGDRARWDDAQLKVLLAELEEVESLPGLDDKTLRKMMDEAVPVDEDGPILPINPRGGESYDYLMVVSENDIDGLWLREVMGVGRAKSWKSEKVSQSRVISVGQLKDAMNEAIKRGELLR